MSDMLKCALLGFVLLSSLTFAADDKIERGKYLVEEIGKCQECHTPRLETGEFDKSKWLKGSTALDFSPKKPVKGWHDSSPDLTGSGRLFQRWGDDGVVKFLVTGKGPRGNGADAPMPTYNLKQEDAEAIVAYLKSLK
jgi:mono/diheme cytochrome c family protein